MIRQSRERPMGELELLIKPINQFTLTLNNDTDSEDAYDNGFLNMSHRTLLQQSLEILREDLNNGQLIEQYEVSHLDLFFVSSFRFDFSFRSFEMLQRRKEGFTFEIASSQLNYYRNRYKDVLPYDQTRVILNKTVSDSDYVNANFINVCRSVFIS